MAHASAFLKIVEDALTRVKEIGVDEVAALLKAQEASRPTSPERAHILLIDVREDGEWAEGHAAGAVHMGKGVIERDIENAVPDKNTKLVLYCGGGYRSALAADNLQKMGYTEVYSLAGGWRAWVERGLPRA